MRRTVGAAFAGGALLVLAGVSAAAASAQAPADATATAALPARRIPANVFISPSGEPFRAAVDAPYAAAAWFAGADADGDGRLTRAEFIRDAERFFRRLDVNGDGVIDGFEIRAYEEEVAPEILPRLGGLRSGEGQNGELFHDRNGGVGRGSAADRGDDRRRERITAADTTFSGAGAFGVLNEPEPVQACDADLDGRVSAAEWRRKSDRRFDLLDPKGVGYLTRDGLPKSYIQAAREREVARQAREAARRSAGAR